MVRTMEVASVMVRGKIEGVGKSKDGKSQYVRFMSGGGPVSVTLEEGIPLGNATIRPGARVVIECDVKSFGAAGTAFIAVSVDTDIPVAVAKAS